MTRYHNLDLMSVALLQLGLVPINLTTLWQSSEKNADIDRLVAPRLRNAIIALRLDALQRDSSQFPQLLGRA